MKYILISLVFCAIILLTFRLMLYPETIISTAKARLIEKLNNEDPEALNYYKYNYIYNGKALFDGPITTKLTAEVYFKGNTLDLLWYMRKHNLTLKQTLKIKNKEVKMKK